MCVRLKNEKTQQIRNESDIPLSNDVMAYLLNQAAMNGKTELNLSYIDEANRHFNSSNG